MARTDAILTPSEVLTVDELNAAANNTIIYKNSTGAVTGVALGANGTVLTSAGATSAPTFSVGGGGGTVTSVSVTTANGVSGSVATATTTPAITLTLGDITPNSVSGTGTIATTGLIRMRNNSTTTGALTWRNAANSANMQLYASTADYLSTNAFAGIEGINLRTITDSNGYLQALSYSAAQGGEVQLFEASGNGTSYTALRGAASQAGNTTYTLPSAYPGVTGYILSSTDAGVMSWTNTAPTVTTNANLTGQVTSVGNATTIANGAIGLVNLDTTLDHTAYYGWIGASHSSVSAVTTSDGATVTLTVQKSGGGDIDLIFSSGQVTVDCTPAITVALTVGSDVSPQANYVYIRAAAPTVLTKSTTGFPTTEEFHPIGTFLVQSAASVQTYGVYKQHLWTDHIWKDSTENGHLYHINRWIRNQNASWISGCLCTPTLTTATTPDTLTIAVSSGLVLQLHPHAFPAFDSSTAGSTAATTFFTPNLVSAPYTAGKDLVNANFLQTAGGVAVSGTNKRISWVIWGSIDEDDVNAKIFVNLPTGFYTSDVTAIADDSKFSVYNIPSDYKGTGFLIAKLTYQVTNSTPGSYALTLIENIDLRGQLPSIFAGGSAASTTEFTDNTFIIEDETDGTKRVVFSVGGNTTAKVLTLTSAVTDNRTVTFPDATGTLLYGGGPIGTPSSGTVTNLTGTASININGTVGATTPTTGVFTSATLGITGTSTGTLLMKGTTSGTVTIQTAAAAGTYTLTLPTDDGTASQVLTTDGAGVLSWTTSAGGFSWGATATSSSGTGLALTATSTASAYSAVVATGTAYSGTSADLGGGGIMLNLACTASGTLTADTTDDAQITSSRTHTANTTVTDNFNILTLSRTNVANSASAVLNAQGAILNIVGVDTQTSGTLTPTYHMTKYTPSARSTGSAIIITTPTSAVATTNGLINITLGASAAANTIMQKFVVDNTQANAIVMQDFQLGTSSAIITGTKYTLGNTAYANGAKVISIVGGSKANSGLTGFDISNFAGAFGISVAGSASAGASDAALYYAAPVSNSNSSYVSGFRVAASSTTIRLTTPSSSSGAGVDVYVGASGAVGIFLGTVSNVNNTTNGLVNYTLSNTQSGATVMQKIDLGTSAQGHTGLLINCYNASSTCSGIKIDPSTTGTGYGINFVNTGASAFSGIRWASISPAGGSNGSGIYQEIITVASGDGYGIRQLELANGNGNAYGWYVDSIGDSSFGNAGRYFSLHNNQSSATLQNRTNDASRILFSREGTHTSGTKTDAFNLQYLKRTQIQNGAGGTFATSGSVLKLENVATQTAGTLTDSVTPLLVVQDADSTGLPVAITQNAVVTTNFRKVIGETATGITIWISNGTDPNGSLSGTAGDICLNGATNKPAYCTGTTVWVNFV